MEGRHAVGSNFGESLLWAWRDLLLAIRFCRRRLGFSMVTIVALALGIGSSASVFGAVDAILLRRLPFPDADSIVLVRSTRSAPVQLMTPSVSQPMFDDIRRGSRSFEYLAISVPDTVAYKAADSQQVTTGQSVSGDWFRIYGVPPLLGRAIGPGDVAPDSPQVVVLSHSMWVNNFAGRSDIVGKTVDLAVFPAATFVPFSPPPKSYVVIGVMPPSDRFPLQDDFWCPLIEGTMDITMGAPARRVRNVQIVGKLRADISISVVRNELSTIAANAARDNPSTDGGWQLAIDRIGDARVQAYRPTLVFMLIAVNCLLLVVGVSIACLFLARSRSRWQDLAIRVGLGATRTHLIRGIVAECLVLVTAGTLAGIALAYAARGAIRRLAPPEIPGLGDLHLSGSFILYCTGTALLVTAAVALLPCLQLSARKLATALKEPLGRTRPGLLHFRGIIIGVQLALTVPLVFASILSVRTLYRISHIDTGYESKGLVTAGVALSAARCRTIDQCQVSFGSLLEGLQGLPGVTGAAIGSSRLLGLPAATEVRIGVGDETPDRAYYDYVSEDFFRVLGVSLTRGRFFERSDSDTAQPVAIVNDVMARRLFGGDAVGKTLFLGVRKSPLRIVGQVAQFREFALWGDVMPAFYMPLKQAAAVPRTYFVIRTSLDPIGERPLRGVIAGTDTNAVVSGLSSVNALIADRTAAPSFASALLVSFGLLTVVVSLIGVYGLISYAVAERWRELAIRIALGAGRGQIIALIAGESAYTISASLGIGLAVAFGLSKVAKSVVFSISPPDGPMVATLILVFVLVSVVGYIVPAWRATTVNPIAIMKGE